MHDSAAMACGADHMLAGKSRGIEQAMIGEVLLE